MAEDLVGSRNKVSANKIVLLLHFFLLCFLVLMVWVTLSLPVIFFRMPPEISVSTTNLTVTEATCSEKNDLFRYHTTDICLSELTEALLYHNCSSPSAKGIPVSGISREQVQLILNGLEFLSPSQKCREEVTPFLCLHLLGLCSGTGIRLQPTYAECVKIRDDVCAREWKQAVTFNIELPDCSILPLSAPSCENNPEINDTDDQLLLQVTDTDGDAIDCREGFYQVNGTKCLPSCREWSSYSPLDTITTDILILMFAIIGFLVSIVAIILSCLFHRRMWEFPSILVIYMVTDILALGVTIIVSYMDRANLLCSSIDILESLQKSTPFCVLSGIIVVYTTIQLILWWLFHVIMLFFKIIYPFHEISIGKSRKAKYLHAFFVSVGLVIPCVPIIAFMVDYAIEVKNSSSNNEVTFWSGGLGFGINSFPPTLCYGKDREVVFYSFILIIDVLTAIGCTLLLIIIWSLHRKHIQRREKNESNSPLIGKPEIKLLIVCAYYIIVVAVALSTLTLATRNFGTLRDAMVRYFSCEQDGHDPSNPCSSADLEKLLHPYTTAFSYVLIFMFPIVNLIYIVNREEMKNTIKRWKRNAKFQDIQLTSIRIKQSIKN